MVPHNSFLVFSESLDFISFDVVPASQLRHASPLVKQYIEGSSRGEGKTSTAVAVASKISRFMKFLPLLAFALLAYAQDRSLATVKEAFEKANITRDADITFDPTLLLEVAFPQASGPDVLVHAGVQIPRNQTAIPPVFGIERFGSLEAPKGTFVVSMVDLDAPIPQDPTEAQIRHFLGGNFELGRTGPDGLILLSNSTPAISNFRQPTPPAGSDPHRYVFLLFQQPAGFNEQTEVNATTSIENFNISLFAQEVGLGNPLGGSFILVGPDPST